MRRVLIFSLAYYPRVGGAEVSIKEITDRIGDVEFHMLTMRFSAADAPEEKLGNVMVHRLGMGGGYVSKILFIPRAAWRAAILNRTLRFDAAWAMMSYMALPAALARIPFVLNLQDGDPFDQVFGRWYIRPLRPLLAWSFRRARIIQVLSAYLAAWPKAFGYRGKILVVPNGADAKRIALAAPAPVDRSPGDILLITTSRLVHKNAVDDIICALALCPASVKLLVAGTGPDEEMLKALAQKLGVSARVRFLGQVNHDALPHLLRACDIFVRPSRTEGFGASFVEAMAAGLPVIATQEGGIADFLFDAKRNPKKPPTGFAVGKDSPVEIAAAIEAVVRDPAQTAAVAQNARAMVFEKYDWSTIARSMRTEVLGRLFHERK